jgi:hypothetical protein
MRDTKTQDFFPKFGHPQRMPMSPLWSSQRVGSPSTLIHPEQSPRSSLISTIKSPQRRGQYKLFGINHNLGDSQTTESIYGNKSLRVTNTRRSSVKCFRWRSSRSLKSKAQISPREHGFEWSLEERGREFKRVSQSVCNVKWVANHAREAWGAFYSPQENLAVGVSETRTCPTNLSGTRLGDRICPVQDLVTEELG